MCSSDLNAYANNYADVYMDAGINPNNICKVNDPWKIPWGHQLDISASYGFKIGNVRATLYGNVNNVYNYNYIMDAQCTPSSDGTWRSAYGVLYSFGRTYTVRLKLNF